MMNQIEYNQITEKHYHFMYTTSGFLIEVVIAL